MLKELIYIIQTKPFTKDFINWCLSYTLAQPVDLDISIIMILLLQYFGLNQLALLTQKAKSNVKQYFSRTDEKKKYELELNV